MIFDPFFGDQLNGQDCYGDSLDEGEESLHCPPNPTGNSKRMKVTLKEFQQPGADFLVNAALERPVTVNTSEQGIGKTWMAAYLIMRLLTKRAVTGFAIVCPAAARADWKEVLKTCGLKPLFVESYHKIAKGKTAWFESQNTSEDGRAKWHLSAGDLLVFDEGHHMRGRNSTFSKLATAAKRATLEGLKVHVMSGTLAVSPADLYALGYLFGFHNLRDFEKFLRAHGCTESEFGWQYSTASGGMERIHAAMAPYTYRLLKRDVPGFPSKTFSVLRLPDDEGLADKAVDELASEAPANPTKNQLNGLSARLRHAIERIKIDQTVDHAVAKVQEGFGVLIFVNFTDVLEAAAIRLQELGIPYFVIQGGMRDDEKARVQREFRENRIPIGLVNIQAGGTGINLQDTVGGVPRLSLVMPTHRAIDLAQCSDRTHRATSLSPAEVCMVLLDAGPDKAIWAAIKRKATAIGQLNGDVSDMADFETAPEAFDKHLSTAIAKVHGDSDDAVAFGVTTFGGFNLTNLR